MDNVCTSSEFTGHRDPYSGDPLEVRLYVLQGGKVRYRIEGAHDVGEPRATFEECFALWSRVGGVAGLRDPSKGGFVCAYTGARMTPVHTPGACRFAGGFRPVKFITREEVLKVLAHISGKDAPKGPAARLEAVPDAPPAPRYHDREPSEEAVRRAGQILEASAPALERSGAAPAKKVSVTVARKVRR